MPGRSGFSTLGGWGTGGTTSAGLPNTLSVDTRVAGTPEYKAGQSIEFTEGFESQAGDEYIANISNELTDGNTGTVNGVDGVEGLYRYGFNGKENDNEVKGEGNQQDYGMRIYDTRLGRFLSMDPMSKSYPYLTPYQFASNSPIGGIDLDGLEFFKKDNTQYTINYKPVVNAPGILVKADNVAHNAMSFIWNVTIGAGAEGLKSVNNYFAGGYKEPTTNIAASFNQFQTEAAKYHTTTPIKQQLKDFGNVATDLRNYELPAQLLIAHKFSGPPVIESNVLTGDALMAAKAKVFEAGGSINILDGTGELNVNSVTKRLTGEMSINNKTVFFEGTVSTENGILSIKDVGIRNKVGNYSNTNLVGEIGFEPFKKLIDELKQIGEKGGKKEGR